MNRIDKPLTRLTRGHRDSIQINKIRNEKGDITMETIKIQNTIRSYKSLYSTKLKNLDEMDSFLDGYCLSQGFYSCTNIMTKKQFVEERVCSAYISTLLFITKGSQDWNLSRSGSRR
jgi:hypothetical protein